MQTIAETYRLRADEARREANLANLVNVRDRHLRAAEAWEVMAVRAAKTLRRRAATEAEKAAREGSPPAADDASNSSPGD